MAHRTRSSAAKLRLARFTYARAGKAWDAGDYRAYDWWWDAHLVARGIDPATIPVIR